MQRWTSGGSRRVWRAAIAVLLFLVLALWGWSWWSSARAPYIAYVGKYRYPEFDTLHEHALDYFVKSLPIGGHRLQIRTFDLSQCGNATSVYQLLSRDPRCLAVIDNAWASDLSQARPIIAGGTLPVVSINADFAGQDYAHKVMFLGGDDYVRGAILSLLKQRNKEKPDYIVFIGERTYWSTPDFVRLLQAAPLNVPASATHLVATAKVLNPELTDLKTELLRHAAAASKAGQELVVVLNVHGDWGDEVLALMDIHEGPGTAPFSNARVIGGAYTRSSNMEFEGRWGVQYLMLTTPEDCLTSRTIHAVQALASAHGEEAVSDSSAGLYVQRCLQAVDMLRDMAGAGSSRAPVPLQDIRGRILSSFQQLRGRVFSLRDASLSFDDDLCLLRRPQIEYIENGRARSYPHQLSLVMGEGMIPNVAIGLNIASIRKVNLDEGTFFAEFNLGLRIDPLYNEVFLPKGATSPDPGLLIFTNSRDQIRVESLSRQPDTSGTYFYRCSGVFGARFEAQDYPRDFQQFPLQVAVREPPGSHGIAVSFEREMFGGGGGAGFTPDLAPGWVPRELTVGVDDAVVYSGAQAGRNEKPVRVVQLQAVMVMKRGMLRPLGSIVLPLVGVAGCGLALLFLRDLRTEHIGEVSVGLFLAFVAYAISYNDMAPETSSITLADWLFYATATVVTAQLFFIIIGSAVASQQMRDSHKMGLVWFVRVVLTALYLVALGWWFWAG